MKVVQVNKAYWPFIGGVEKHVQDVAEALLGKVDVEVLVANTTRSLARDDVNGVPVTRVPSWGTLRSAPIAPGFYGAIKRMSADIYHLHFPNPVGELAYLAAGSPGKLVVTYHADIVRQKLLVKAMAPFIKRLLSRADAVMVSSPNLISSSPWLRPVAEKCRVVPFGIDAAPFRLTPDVETRARSLRDTYGGPIVLFVGRLIYYKGLSFLVEAIKKVDAQLVIVGTGPLEEDLRKQARELGIEKRIHFAGRASDEELPAYYHACDLFVLPSIANSEAFGFVQLEAHACGKAVVSTNLPTGVPYANLDGITGKIVPPEDANALADAMNALLNDSALRARLGGQAKTRVETEFSREALGAAVLKTYAELV